ncbi:C-type lectin domain family 4 member F-like [Clupea harengus]|uniref:C-type lectin domain family 4 member F-like n=1 Tax=Clupea harengus TaxID=7950 RepID=A0A6P8GNV4_CLUHA|nr:C-type lectin domain family 4 member F-like [Clupea harengus]
MSEDKIYSNLMPTDTPEDSTTATQTDEVTYSDIDFIKTGHSHQKQTDSDGDGVYSLVNLPKNVPGNELDPQPPSDSSNILTPAKPDPANSSPLQHPEKESRPGISQRCTVLFLSVCVLLLAIAVTMVALYAVKVEQCSGVKEQVDLLRVEHANVTMLLREKYDNATAMTRTLEAKLTETEKMLLEQKNRNDDLTKLKNELQGVKCADDWEYFNGAFYHFSTDEKTWTESRDACVTIGGHLVIITSQQEMEFLKTKANHWIGLNDAQEEDKWRWVDSTPLTDPKFWGNGQPDNAGDEDCARIDINQKWNDAPCQNAFKRICESRSCRT